MTITEPTQPRATLATGANAVVGQSGVEVRFEGVTKRFPDGTSAVNGVDLLCPAGQITVFVGPSGCGKTTSLRMVNRMIEPTAGRVFIGDADVATFDESDLRRQMGYVIQNAGLFPHRKILDNITTVPRLLGTGKREARQRATELMQRVGLDESLASKYPYQLSGGQQQRVGVARALAANPPVLLMDEPFSAVDPVVRAELQDELLRLQQEIGKTIIFVTHDIDEAVRIADQIVVFQRGGTVAQAATPAELLTAPANDFVTEFIGPGAGIKWLSLLPGTTVDVATQAAARTPAEAAPDSWTVLVDEQGFPRGWVHGGPSPRDANIGRVFAPHRDNLRLLMDMIVSSATGKVAAIDRDGHYIGTVDHERVIAAVRQQKRPTP